MKAKRIISFMIAVVVFLACAAGCGSTAAGSEAAQGASNKVVIMGNAYTLPEEEAAWNEVCDAFTAETGIEIVQNRQGGWDDVSTRLQATKLSGEQVDLIVVGMGTVSSTLGPAGSVMDMTDLMAGLRDRFPEGVLDSCTKGDKLWCFPYQDASGTTCFYNKTMFDQYGLKVPTNLQEWTDCAKVLSENGVIPFMIQGKDTWAWAMPFFDTYGQATDGNSVQNIENWLQNQSSFENEEVYEGFNALKSLYDNGILTSESFDTDEAGMLANYVQGKCAMIFCGTWDYGTLLSMEPDFENAACEFPSVIEGKEVCHAFATGDGAISIPSWADEANLDNTMRFVEYLTRPENAQKIICANAGGSPIFEVVNGAVGETDDVTTFLNEVSVPHSSTYLDWIWPSQVNDAMCNVVPAVISGSMTAEEAAAYVQETLDTLVSTEDYTYAWWDAFTQEQWDDVTPGHIPDVTQWK